MKGKSMIVTEISINMNNRKDLRDIEVYKWQKKYVITEDEKVKDDEEYIEIGNYKLETRLII